MITLHTQLQLL